MSLVLDILFAVAWATICFFAVRYVARRYFDQASRANVIGAVAAVLVAAIAVVMQHRSTSPQAVSPPAVSRATVARVAGPLPPTHLRNVSAACKDVGQFRADGFGALDGIEAGTTILTNGATLPSTAALTIVGWGGDRSQVRPARAVCLVVDGHVVDAAKIVYGGLRPDVAAWKHSDALLPVAYTITIGAARLGAGKHTIRTAARSLDGTTALLLNELNIVVK